MINTKLKVYLIRHAQSTLNQKPDLITGRSPEIPLTEQGKKGAKNLGEKLLKEGVIFNTVYSSPLKRSKDTCEEVCKVLQIPREEIVEVPELIEYSAGEWEEQKRQEVYTPELVAKMNTIGPFFIPPKGESQRMVERRVSNWFEDEILYNPDFSNGEFTIGIFSHGLTIKCFLHYVMGFNDRLIYKITLDNGSVSVLRFDQTGWYIDKINDTSHLD